jgi:toxin CcdB
MSATMAQFDAFINPIPSARGAYPFVVTLQADVGHHALEQIVAPLVPVASMPKSAGRLTPIVSIEGALHAVLVPALTGIPARDLSLRHCSVAESRSELLAAIDFLFFGV